MTVKTLSDQVKDLENTRAAKAARMADVMQKSIEEGRSSDETESEEFDTLELEVKQIDQDLVRLKKLEVLNGQRAKAIEPDAGKSTKGASLARESGPAIIVKRDKDEDFKGQNFTRMVIARAYAHLNLVSGTSGPTDVGLIAERRWGKTNPTLVEVIKAAVAGGGSGSGEWGAELVQADTSYTGDFIEFLNSKTVYNQLPLREVPANVAIKGQDGAATGYWVGESKGIPVSKADFSTINLTPLKVAALAVVSNELLRDSTPAAEGLVRDALVEAASQRIDTTFLSTTAASAGVSPAGLLNGVSATAATGSLSDALFTDIKTLYNVFNTAKNSGGLYFVMNPALAMSLQLMQNPLGQTQFPGITMSGGTFLGYPVVTGDNVPADILILIKPSDVWKIGAGGVEISMSRDATIEQDTAPQGASDTPVAMSANPVNMFQTESTAIKIVQSMNFAKRRSHAVQYVSGALYGGSET